MRDTQVDRIVVQEKTRKEILSMFPGLLDNREMWGMFAWIFFTPNKDENEIRGANNRYLAKLLGKSPRHFSVGKALDSFQKITGVDLLVTSPIIGTISRTITIPKHSGLRELIIGEILTPISHKIKPVHLVTGEDYVHTKAYKLTMTRFLEHYAQTKQSGAIYQYFGTLNPEIYTAYLHNISQIQFEFQLLDRELDNKEYHQLLGLSYLASNLPPLYKPTAIYRRVYSNGYSLQNIKREHRRRILSDTEELDLKSAQLSIAVYLWDVSSIVLLLEDNIDVWAYLHAVCGKKMSEQSREEIKSATYAITFGGGEKTARAELKSFTEDEVNALFESSQIKQLRAAQKQALYEITRNGGVMSAQGVWIERTGSPQSTLSLQMQSYERAIIEQIYLYALTKQNDVQIVSHEHDGVSVRFLNKDKRDEIFAGFNRVVRAMGRKLRIKISISIKR